MLYIVHHAPLVLHCLTIWNAGMWPFASLFDKSLTRLLLMFSQDVITVCGLRGKGKGNSVA